MSNFIRAEEYCVAVKDGTHNSPKKTENGVKLATSKNIIGGNLDLSTAYFISEEDANEVNKRSKVDKNDILISMIGTVGEVCLIKDDPDFVIKNVGLLKNKCAYKAKWLYFYLKTNQAQNLIKERLRGTTQQYLSLGELRNFPVLLPKNEDHLKNAVNILWELEQKIQLNTQINQTLEQIAQTIFKSWFIDFDPVHAKANALANGQTTEQATQAAMAVISGKNTQELHRLQTANPKQYQQLWEIAEAFPSGFDEEGVPRGWEQTTLSEVCSMKNGYAFKSSDWTEEGIPVIKIGSVKPMIVEVDGNGFVDEEHSVLHSEFLLTEGDIVVGLTGYVGEVGRIPQGRTAMLNQRVAKFIPNKLNEQQDYYSFVYCLVRDKSFKAFAETNAKGSAQANISTKELLNYSIILASPEIQMKFESLIKPLLDKILVNSGNNEYLSKVRDLLLPNLLSGEIHL
ncbi:restriction endonuclease subunit S [Glaesserella parasuis]|nr:restriction endonuclease subunit S [Glaesserella parasuis]MDO9787005.1 restriction endonuclease subunit S [Glaesserella parasuis]MDP0181813.1 restriction endonuclease subunit S [Glaesserella parasuis]MDP0190390.1 restriction endonuclease subunit S [Glaesserella parasuis]MDP0201087.1 restriction endonuclease subunit S [Glaesserella parasuis]